MKQITKLLMLIVLINLPVLGQSMDKFFRKPVLEEGENNIIMQNRCGNRLTLMFGPKETQLEFVYKPNAYHHKDYRSRNFSNRDNQTVLFPSFVLPDIYSTDATYEYDPFVTRIRIAAPSGAKNTITVLNIADENAFVISARSPLLLAFRPHDRFNVQNGLLTETFTERGENIVSYIRFPGYEQSRYRVLADGTTVLQLLENDVVIIGGEESMSQVDPALRKMKGLDLDQMIARNKELVQPFLATAQIHCSNPDFQKVLDLNKEIIYSMVDEGGATFGALCRCYYLIWVRDGSMSTSLMARSGFTQLLPKWADLLLNNPSIIRRDDGTLVPEFTQILGTRWSKSEDDGIFYAMMTLFTTIQTTGNDDLLHTGTFEMVLESVDRFLEKTWDPDRGMIGSDTRGETSLQSSPYYGYDVVNGEMYHRFQQHDVEMTPIFKSYSLYNQVNTYNLLLMATVMLARQGADDQKRMQTYGEIAGTIKQTIRDRFVNAKGTLNSGFELYADGTEKWVPFGPDCDYWETAWANSLGPYYPAPELQWVSAREVRNDWTKYRNYGYCPWNTLSRYLYEYGMDSQAYEEMLSEEISEALTLTKKFTMPGAVTEYQKAVEGWRALPFQIGALYYTMTAQVIQSMPMGIGVRASGFVDRIDQYRYKLSRIDAVQTGEGDVVGSFTINNKVVPYSLQIPESLLRDGLNRVVINRAAQYDGFRLYSSTAKLLTCNARDHVVEYEFSNPVESQFVFENYAKAGSVRLYNAQGVEIPVTVRQLDRWTVVEADTQGEFKLVVEL